MDEEYHQQQSNICSQNWWSTNNNTNNPSGQRSINRYESRSGAQDSLVQHDMNKKEMIRLEDSSSVSNNSSSLMFLNTNLKMPGTAPCSILSNGGDDGGLLVDTNLQHMGLRLSSQEVDWDQALLGGGKADHQSSFRSMLEEEHHISSSANFQPEIQWKPNKIFTRHGLESSLGQSGFSLDQPQSSSPNEENINIACHNLPGIYIENSSSMLHSLLGPNNNESQQQQVFLENRCMEEDYSYGTENYGMKSNESQFIPPSSFSSDNKFSQFVRNSSSSQNHLQFSNNAKYWNASSARVVPDVMQHQYPKNNLKEGNKDSSMAVKKSGIEASRKRPRNESSPSTLPPFKVKKEKMGDRITTLQQLVSPFGKTDTASVLSEAIEYIKILHEQVLVLAAPYMKNGAMMHQHHHQYLEKPASRDSEHMTKQDLRSSGLCLVPLSSTFPVTHETSVDFWTPTYGGPLR